MNNFEPILGSETEKIVEKFINQQGGKGSGDYTSSLAICFILVIISLGLMFNQ